MANYLNAIVQGVDPNVGTRAIAASNALREQSSALMQREQQNALRRNVGNMLARNDLSGARTAAFQGGDIDAGSKIGELMAQHSAQEQKRLGQGIEAAALLTQQGITGQALPGALARLGFDAEEAADLAAIPAQALPGLAQGAKAFFSAKAQPVPGRDVPYSPEVEAQKARMAQGGRQAVPGRDVPYPPEVFQQMQDLAAGRKATPAQFETVTDPQTGLSYQQNTVTGERKAAPAPKLSPGQAAIDREAGKDLAGFVAGGGFADVQKNLGQLDDAITQLERGGVSGTTVGITPDFVLSATNPRAVDTQEMVAEVAQRNLRLVLGAQFTEKEGDRLIARAYNPYLDEKVNVRRVRALKRSIISAANAKQEAWDYMQKNGTLAGFKGKLWTMADFERAVDAAGTAGKADDVSRETSEISNIPPAAIQELKANPDTADEFDEVFGRGAAARILGGR